MKKFFLLFLFFFNLYALENINLSFSIKELNNSLLAQSLKKHNIFYKNLPIKDIIYDLKRKEFFIRKIKKLSNEDKSFLEANLINNLYQIFLKDFKKQYQPNELELKSFYEMYKKNFSKNILVDLTLLKFYNIEDADRVYSKLMNHKKIDLKKYKPVKLEKANLSGFEYKIRRWIYTAKINSISTPIKINNEYVIIILKNKKVLYPSYKNLKSQLKKILLNLYIDKKLKEMEK